MPAATWLDRAIAWASPEAGVRRLAARFSFDQAQGLMARAYDAAKTGRRTDGWVTGGSSANAEIGPAAARIRARARDLVRNNPWAATAVRKSASKVVGTGITPRLGPDAPQRAGAMEEWAWFVDECDPERRTDFNGLQALVARTVFEAGECLVRFLPRPRAAGLRVPLQLQVLEPDHLDTSRTQPLPEGGAIIQGVEYAADGSRAAYWLFAEHPGEQPTSFGARGLVSQRVPAAEVLHVFDRLRPGQARGVPLMTPVVMRLRGVDDTEDARLMQQKVAACFAAFVKRARGPAASPLNGAGAATDDRGRRIETLAPGRIDYLGLDEEISFAQPPSVEGYGEFMTMQLHAVAAGAGITYEMLTGDLSRVNYSSLRAGMIDFWDLVDAWQWHMMVPQLCQPVWNRVMGLSVALGRLPVEARPRATWTPPRRRWVDPVKEVEATRSAVRAGLISLPEAMAEMGADPDRLLEEIADFNRRLDQLGVVLDSDARRAIGKPDTAPSDEPTKKEPTDA